jgi:hypothetical protein
LKNTKTSEKLFHHPLFWCIPQAKLFETWKFSTIFHAYSTLVWGITCTDDAVMELLVPNFHEAYQTGIPFLGTGNNTIKKRALWNWR